jgi:hypothetical protein
VLAHGAGQVGLVGEAEVGGEDAEALLAAFHPIEGVSDPDPVAVAGERDAELAREGAAEAERGDAEQLREREQSVRLGEPRGDGLARGGDQGALVPRARRECGRRGPRTG